jgi:phage gp29-like protein
MANFPLGVPTAGTSGLVDSFGRDLRPSDEEGAGGGIGRDPTQDKGRLRDRARIYTREIPNAIVQVGWQVSDVRAALTDLVVGNFDRPAQLQDAVAADSRVQSAMRQRSGGLLGRPVQFQIPKKLRDDETAKKCMRSWANHWPQMHAEPALLDLLETAHSLGFSYSQILWDTAKKVWKPYLKSFNARYSWYHWTRFAHVVVTMDGSYIVSPGDGHWVLHAPYGQYRGWMRGALRAVAQWWLARNYSLRDCARYCERHGFPILMADTPFGADPDDISSYQGALSQLGQESVLQLPGSVDTTKYGKYDLRYLEPKDRAWQAFLELIRQCNDEITLALLGQNLTSEVKEGSLAAARVHADVRQVILEADARALARTLYTQVLRPFAALNFGDARYAPRVTWDVRPQEDLEQKARTFQAFATALNELRQAGFALDEVERFARAFGIRGMSLHDVDPVQVEARLAQSTGKVSSSEDDLRPSADKPSKKKLMDGTQHALALVAAAKVDKKLAKAGLRRWLTAQAA